MTHSRPNRQRFGLSRFWAHSMVGAREKLFRRGSLEAAVCNFGGSYTRKLAESRACPARYWHRSTTDASSRNSPTPESGPATVMSSALNEQFGTVNAPPSSVQAVLFPVVCAN